MFAAPGLKQAFKSSPFKDRVIDDASSCKAGAVPAPLDFQVVVVLQCRTRGSGTYCSSSILMLLVMLLLFQAVKAFAGTYWRRRCKKRSERRKEHSALLLLEQHSLGSSS